MSNKVILFDGVCNFCNFWVNFIIDRDKKNIFKFAPLQSEPGQIYLKKLGLSTEDFDSFVLVDKDQYFTKSEAGLRVVKSLSGPVKLIYVFIILPRPIRDGLYNLIGKYRYKLFGKTESCLIPTPEERARFLS